MSSEIDSSDRVILKPGAAYPRDLFRSGPGNVEQIVFKLKGDVDATVFEKAWSNTVARHGVLRSRGSQATTERASVVHLDHSSFDSRDKRAECLAAFIRTDRSRGFERGDSPLIRIALVRDPSSCTVVLSLDHGLLDWRSISTLLRELMNEYQQLVKGEEGGEVSALLTRGRQDPAAILATRVDESFWREYFNAFEGAQQPDVPGADAFGSSNGHEEELPVIEFRLDKETSDSVRRLRKAAGVTLNNLVQAAWALLRVHYAGSRDVVFGITRSCRRSTPPGSEDAIGPFTNVIPMRVQVKPEFNVFELLWHVRDQHRKVREHECAPLALVQECIGMEEGQRLFDSVVEFDLRDPMQAMQELFPEDGPHAFEHYAAAWSDLDMQVFGEDEMVIRLKYNKARYHSAIARQMLSHFMRLLGSMTREPWLAALDLPYLDEDEAAPCRWPGAQRLVVAGKAETLHERFSDQAGATPNAVAVRCGDDSISYAALEDASTRLAQRLAEKGARPNTLIGLCAERSIEQIVGLLAILKAGAGYLPLDPDYPADRLTFLVEDSGAKLVVATDEVRGRLGEVDATFVHPSEAPDGENSLDYASSAESLAYVIYTSGSTGQPKGVQVTHRNVMRLFDVSQSWLAPGIGDVWTMFHSFAFDFSVWEIWGALLHGGCLEIVPKEIARSPEAFHDLLARRRVTVLNQTPSAFSQLMKVDAQSEQRLSDLRLVVFGGEQLDVGSLLPWFERYGDEKPCLVNMYGITETTVHVTYRPVTSRDAKAFARPGASLAGSPIGVPLPDLYVRLLDERGNPVPPGVPGEICVGGPGVTLGYLNREELNCRHFIDDPFNPGARLYRSGDFARRMPSGELAYLGRRDAQVKVRGFRIDLGEISGTLKRLPGIEDGLAVVREACNGERRLVGYYVSSDSELSEAKLRTMLAEKLPAHMMPAALIRIERVPMNNNNKIDYKALPGVVESRAGLAKEELPGTETEKLLADIWADVLERPVVGRNDDFFGLGGDSVTALQVVAKARACGLEVSPRDIFNNSELAALAHVARPAASAAKASEHVGGSVMLTPVQREFFERNLDNPNHCNEACLFRLQSECNIDVLERAFHTVIAHHDALRTCFREDQDGEVRGEHVKAHEAFEFSRVELDHLEAEERREAMRLITQDIQSSLSIRSGVLLRAAHFTGGLEDGDRLLIVVHRLAMDTASWGILLQDLEHAYEALLDHREPSLSGTSSYAEWARTLEQHVPSSAELSHWQSIVDVPVGDLWNSHDTPGREADAETLEVSFDAQETAALLSGVHAAYGTGANDLILAGVARTFAAQWPDCERLRIDMRSNGRDHAFNDVDISRTVGAFAYVHPLVLELSRMRDTPRAICEIKQALRGADRRGHAYGLLRFLDGKGRRSLGKAEKARILISLSGRCDRLLDGRLLTRVNEDAGSSSAPGNVLTHDLAIDARVHDDSLKIAFRFNTKAITRDGVAGIAARCRESIQELIQHCSTRDRAYRTPGDFPLARLEQSELDAFPMPLEQAEDILPLTPLQRLFHALTGTDSDVGFDQWIFNLEGNIDEQALEEAWRELFRRHDALRTVVVDKSLKEPHQVVLRDVEFRLQRTDLRLLSESEQQRRISEFLDVDRQEGFELSVAPLTRVTLFRLDAKRWTLVWSHWQAQVDGWSWPILSAELGEIHDAIRDGRSPELKSPGSYRAYINWLMNRDLDEYSAFWREYLGKGSRATSFISRTRRKGDAQRISGPVTHKRIELALDLSERIRRVARDLKFTPSGVFQAAWALVVSGMTSRFDVTLGAAFSGRTAGIPIEDNTVGPFLNDLPVRIHVAPTERLDNWLASLRKEQADLNHYQNVSPSEVHGWADNRGAGRMFDTLLVFQNYATGEAASRWGRSVRVTEFRAGVRTNYPISLAITPEDRFRLDFYYSSEVVEANTIKTSIRHLVTVLETITRNPDIRLETILKHIGEPQPDMQDTGNRNRRATDRIGPAEEESHGIAYAARDGGSVEAQVAGVCREVLDLANIRRNANFFELGAQSVSLIEIHARLQEQLKRTFPIVKLFQHPTVDALVRYLEEGDADDGLWAASRRGAARRAALNRRRQSYQDGRQER